MSTCRSPIVLHYTGYVRDSGGIHAVLRSLSATKRFRMILGVSPQFVKSPQTGIKVWRGPAVDGEAIDLVNAWRTFRVAWRVRRWLNGGADRIFHGHSRAGVLVALWLRLLGAPRSVATVHVLGRRRWFYRWAKRALGSRLRWLSPAMADYYGEPPVGWSECLPDCFSPRQTSAARMLNRGICTFGCAGSLVEVKHWELLLYALALVPSTVPLRIVHVGGVSGESNGVGYREQLLALTRKLGLEDRFTWRGEISEMGNFYREIDCFVVSSALEASSVAALDALAANVPLLAPDKGGTRALVEHCAGGWLFKANDANALAAELTRLATDTRIAGWRVDDVGLEHFSAAGVADAHADVYHRLLKEDGRV